MSQLVAARLVQQQQQQQQEEEEEEEWLGLLRLQQQILVQVQQPSWRPLVLVLPPLHTKSLLLLLLLLLLRAALWRPATSEGRMLKARMGQTQVLLLLCRAARARRRKARSPTQAVTSWRNWTWNRKQA